MMTSSIWYMLASSVAFSIIKVKFFVSITKATLVLDNSWVIGWVGGVSGGEESCNTES
jgi:hypothetical protein